MKMYIFIENSMHAYFIKKKGTYIFHKRKSYFYHYIVMKKKSTFFIIKV